MSTPPCAPDAPISSQLVGSGMNIGGSSGNNDLRDRSTVPRLQRFASVRCAVNHARPRIRQSANVAFPICSAACSSSRGSDHWVLNSYIRGHRAIMTPIGFNYPKVLCRKRVLRTAASASCCRPCCVGIAQSPLQSWRYSLCGRVLSAQRWFHSAIRSADFIRWRTRICDGSVQAYTVMVCRAGPVIGGWLTDYYILRWVFYLNVPWR